MDIRKIRIRIAFVGLLLLAICWPVSVAQAVQGVWSAMTSFKEIRQLRLIDGSVYAATSGGLMIIDDPLQAGDYFVNIDGLGTADLYDVIEDATGQVWIAAYGRLIKFDESTPQQFLFFDRDDNLMPLFCVEDDDDNLWVGTRLGLALFSKSVDGGQRQDTYTSFGELSADPDVYDILLDGDSIWLATSAGLAVSSKLDPNLLKSPLNWTTFSSANYPELKSNSIRRVVKYAASIYMATDKGLYRLDAQPGNPDTTCTQIPAWIHYPFSDLRVENDTLFFFANSGGRYGGVGVIVNGEVAHPLYAGLPSIPNTGLSSDGFQWLATSYDGLYSDYSGDFAEYVHTGLPVNTIADLGIDRDGRITIGTMENWSAAQSGEVWRTYQLNDSVEIDTVADTVVYDTLRGASPTDVMIDSLGRAWVGAFGTGLFLIDNDSMINFDETNSTLLGNNDNMPSSLAYVVIRGLATDGRYIYAGAYRANNGYPIVIGDLNNLHQPSGWTAIGDADGFETDRPIDLACFGRLLAVATENDGVYLCFVGWDPFAKKVDSIMHLTESNSFLPSNSATAVQFTHDGTLWVGTNFGLSRFDWGTDQFYDVPMPEGLGPEVVDIEFDVRGNIWIAAPNGLGRLDKTRSQWETFPASSDGPLSNDVRAVAIDAFSNDVYVATGAGISILRFGVNLQSDIQQVLAYPNPYIIRAGDEELNFNLQGDAGVRIFALSGELVKRLSVNEPWYGQNESGNQVASGVYLFVVSNESGDVGRGKFVLIRE
jgi:hypothetical protein